MNNRHKTLLGVCLFLGAAVNTSAADLQEGMRLYRQGKFVEAVRFFEAAAAEDPQSEPASEGLARSLAMAGHTAFRDGNLFESKRLLEKSLERMPQEVDVHLLLALVLFRQGDFSYARYEVRRVLDLAPDNAQGHDLLGDILYQEGYLDLAIPEWQKAKELNPGRAVIQEKIERARREMNIEEGYGRDVSRHFIIMYDGPLSRALVQSAGRILEDAYETIRRELGSSPRGDITVILYSKLAFREVTGTPAWVGGTFDGKIRVPVGGLTGEADVERLRPILAHEVSHAFLRSMVSKGVPLWLEEGLAEYFEGRPQWLRAHGGTAYSSLTEVEQALRGKGAEVENAYAAAEMAVRTFIDEKGFGALRRVLEALAMGAPLAKAMETEARLSVPELEEKWRQNMVQ